MPLRRLANLTGPAPARIRGVRSCLLAGTQHDIDRLAAADRDRLLGIVRFADGWSIGGAASVPVCTVPLQALQGVVNAVLWFGQGPCQGGRSGRLDYRADGETLFGMLHDDRCSPSDIEVETHAAYTELLRVASERGYPHVYRIWNYLPQINAEPDGLEVYKAFSIGRRRAFDDYPPIGAGAFPAACAIGTDLPKGLTVYFLAARRPLVALSNPRQIEAFHYPPEHGPRSPAFSRAVFVSRDGGSDLHISGTASIVGHATHHAGDAGAQLAETAANLAAVLATVSLSLGDLGEESLFTVYLRRRADLGLAERLLSEVLPPGVKLLFLHGDICRGSLLVEIEGIISMINDTARPGGMVVRNGWRQQQPMNSLTDLELEIAQMIVSALSLDANAEAVDPNAPLYGEGLGLDSIDMLELAVAIKKRYGFQIRSDDPDTVRTFSSLRNLASTIEQRRIRV